MRAIPDVSLLPLAELVSLAGRTAVVTGGARGIGRACGARLAEAGAAVLLADVDVDGAAEAAATIGRGSVAAHVDVRDAGSVRALADQALAGQGRLDIWMNSAGIYPSRPLLDLSEDDWDAVVDVNLRGTFVGAREAARAMIAAGNGGVIVNVSSTAAYRAARAEASSEPRRSTSTVATSTDTPSRAPRALTKPASAADSDRN